MNSVNVSGEINGHLRICSCVCFDEFFSVGVVVEATLSLFAAIIKFIMKLYRCARHLTSKRHFSSNVNLLTLKLQEVQIKRASLLE